VSGGAVLGAVGWVVVVVVGVVGQKLGPWRCRGKKLTALIAPVGLSKVYKVGKVKTVCERACFVSNVT
jgi:hypothetical protein